MDGYTPIFDILQTGIILAAKVAAPILLVSMGVGLIIAIFQAATSIQEQTITFVPKLFLIGLILVASGGWILQNMKGFMILIFNTMLEL